MLLLGWSTIQARPAEVTFPCSNDNHKAVHSHFGRAACCNHLVAGRCLTCTSFVLRFDCSGLGQGALANPTLASTPGKTSRLISSSASRLQSVLHRKHLRSQQQVQLVTSSHLPCTPNGQCTVRIHVRHTSLSRSATAEQNPKPWLQHVVPVQNVITFLEWSRHVLHTCLQKQSDMQLLSQLEHLREALQACAPDCSCLNSFRQ